MEIRVMKGGHTYDIVDAVRISKNLKEFHRERQNVIHKVEIEQMPNKMFKVLIYYTETWRLQWT